MFMLIKPHGIMKISALLSIIAEKVSPPPEPHVAFALSHPKVVQMNELLSRTTKT